MSVSQYGTYLHPNASLLWLNCRVLTGLRVGKKGTVGVVGEWGGKTSVGVKLAMGPGG